MERVTNDAILKQLGSPPLPAGVDVTHYPDTRKLKMSRKDQLRALVRMAEVVELASQT